MNGKLFYKYPTRKKPLGTRQTVSNATVEQMHLIQSRYYVPNNTALVVTGDVDPQEVFEMPKRFSEVGKTRPAPFEEFPLVEHPPLKKARDIWSNSPFRIFCCTSAGKVRQSVKTTRRLMRRTFFRILFRSRIRDFSAR